MVEFFFTTEATAVLLFASVVTRSSPVCLCFSVLLKYTNPVDGHTWAVAGVELAL